MYKNGEVEIPSIIEFEDIVKEFGPDSIQADEYLVQFLGNVQFIEQVNDIKEKYRNNTLKEIKE